MSLFLELGLVKAIHRNLLNFRAVSLAGLIVALCGCSASSIPGFKLIPEFLGGTERAENTPVEVEAGDPCLKKIGPDLKSWLETGSPSAVPALDCSLRGLDKFSSRVRGQTPGSWSKAELARYFSFYFFDGEKLSTVAGWIEELFRIKQSLIGGSADRLTQAEVQRLRDLLAAIRPSLDELGAGVRYAFFKVEGGRSDEALKAATQIEKVFEALAQQIRAVNVPRPVLSMRLILAGAKSLGAVSEKMESWFPAAQVVKSMLAGGDDETVRPDQWPALLESSGKLWALMIRVWYELGESDDLLGRDILRLEKAIDDGVRIISNGMARQDSSIGGFTRQQITRLVEELGQKKLLTIRIGRKNPVFSASTINTLLPKILSKVLHGNWRPDTARMENVFLPSQLQALHEITRDWIFGQKQINRVIGDRDSAESEYLVRELAGLRIGQNFNEPSSIRARVQLVDLLSRGRRFVTHDDGSMVIARQGPSVSLRKYDLRLLNGVRALFSAFLRGYPHDSKAAMEFRGVTKSEAQEIYLDIRSLGRELGWIDVRNTDAGERTYMEANLFTSVAQADGFIGLAESVEWMHIVLSGSVMADRVFSDLSEQRMLLNGISARSCALSQVYDVFGREKLDSKCFRMRLIADFTRYTQNLPGLSHWYSQQPEIMRKKFIEALENASRSVGVSPGPIDSSDFKALFPILHYLENLMMIYDQNQSEILDYPEVWSAFPLISPFIKEMGKGQADSESVQRTVYSWILHYGEPPDMEKDSNWLKYWYFRHRLSRESASRMDLMKMIASFSVFSRNTRVRDLGDYFESRKNRLRLEIESGDPVLVTQLTRLMRCQPVMEGPMLEILRANVHRLSPGGEPLSREKFVEIMKQLVFSDPRAQLACMPF